MIETIDMARSAGPGNAKAARRQVPMLRRYPPHEAYFQQSRPIKPAVTDSLAFRLLLGELIVAKMTALDRHGR